MIAFHSSQFSTYLLSVNQVLGSVLSRECDAGPVRCSLYQQQGGSLCRGGGRHLQDTSEAQEIFSDVSFIYIIELNTH